MHWRYIVKLTKGEDVYFIIYHFFSFKISVYVSETFSVHLQALQTDLNKLLHNGRPSRSFSSCISIGLHSFPQAYNIHVNGVLHCRVRYSQLLGLHEQVSLQSPQYTHCCHFTFKPVVTCLHVWHTDSPLNASTSPHVTFRSSLCCKVGAPAFHHFESWAQRL